MNEKRFKKLKTAIKLEESRGMAVAQSKDPQTIKGYFPGILGTSLCNIAMTKSFAFSIFYLIKSYH